MLKKQNMVAIAELSKGPSYQGFMGKWPFMVGSRLKACHTLPVNWTEFFFVDKSAIKAVFNWRVHLETVFTGSLHVSLVSQCVPAIWLEGRKIIWIPPWFGDILVSSVVAYELFCVSVGLVINIILRPYFWRENINSTRNKHQMFQQLLLTGGWQVLHGICVVVIINLTLGPMEKKIRKHFNMNKLYAPLFITFLEWINNHLAFSLDPLLWPICSTV